MRSRNLSCTRSRPALGGLALVAATTMAAPQSRQPWPMVTVDAGTPASGLTPGAHHAAGYTVLAD